MVEMQLKHNYNIDTVTVNDASALYRKFGDRTKLSAEKRSSVPIADLARASISKGPDSVTTVDRGMAIMRL
jgi:hypothetical protein